MEQRLAFLSSKTRLLFLLLFVLSYINRENKEPLRSLLVAPTKEEKNMSDGRGWNARRRVLTGPVDRCYYRNDSIEQQGTCG